MNLQVLHDPTDAPYPVSARARGEPACNIAVGAYRPLRHPIG